MVTCGGGALLRLAHCRRNPSLASPRRALPGHVPSHYLISSISWSLFYSAPLPCSGADSTFLSFADIFPPTNSDLFFLFLCSYFPFKLFPFRLRVFSLEALTCFFLFNCRYVCFPASSDLFFLCVCRYFPYKHHRRSVPVSADLHSRFLWSAGECFCCFLLDLAF